MKDEMEFIIQEYGTKITAFLGEDDELASSFFSESEEYVDRKEKYDSGVLNYGFHKKGESVSGSNVYMTFYQDYSISSEVLTDFTFCEVAGLKFVKIITPFTRERSYDLIIALRKDMEKILKELNVRQMASNFKPDEFPVIGLDFTEIKKNTIDFLLNEDFRKFCIEHRIPLKRGVVLEGKPGCLAADTKIYVKSENDLHGSYYSIKDAYYKFNNIEHGNIKGRRFWDKEKKKFIQSLTNEGKLEYREIYEIIYSGIKEVFEITTESEFKVRATAEHPFKVPEDKINGRGILEKDNFVALKDLIIGEEIFCKNLNKKKMFNSKNKKENRREINGIQFHPYAWTKKVRKYEYKRIHFSRLVIEANMNNLSVEEYINIIKHDEEKAKKLKYLSPEQIVHHLNENVIDDRFENLKVLSKKEHDRHHAKNEYFSDTLPILERIISIKKVGEEETFDITMKGNSKNFVANGFISHNTGKTMSLRWLKNKALENGIQFHSFSSPQEFLQDADSYFEEGKKIFVFEDFDTALIDRGKTGDTPNAVLGRVLNILEGVNQIHDTVSVFTTNKINVFDSAFLRPGRIDRVITYSLPGKKEVEKFLSAYIPDVSNEVRDRLEEYIQDVSSDVSYAILKGICDDINIFLFENDAIGEDEAYEIAREKLSGANKRAEAKNSKDMIL